MRVDSLLKLLNECKNPSNCEYLVFRSDGRSISTDFSVEERTKIYEIITILPFPGNTNPLYAERIAELTSNIPYSLDTQEKLVIETVLKQVIGQDLYTLPIPKSMAQFYFFMSQQGALVGAQQQDLIKAITSFEQATLDGLRASRLHEEEIEAIQQGRDSVFQYLRLSISTARKQRFAAVNLAPGFDCMWYGANSSLVKEVVHAADDALPAIYQQLATSWLSNFKKIYQDGGRFYSRFLSGSLSPYIKKLFEFEITVAFSPQFANTCVLYRGSKDGLAGDLTYLATRDNHSFSYGNGFCEGMILDEGACALRYMIATYVNNSKGQCSGHVVFVNTTNYRNHKLERTLFWIPPLNYIARVCAQGETFHARTAGVEGFEMGASLFEKSGEYYSKRTFRVTDELMSSPAMLELINSRRVYATLAPYMRDHAITVHDSKELALVPNLQDLKLNPSLLPDSLLSFLTINDFSTKAEDLNKTNASLHSPLTLAAHKRDLIMAKHLVAQGARIDAQNALGNTALHICADTKDHYFAAWLLAVAKVLKLNLAVKNNNAKTPFDLARANGFEILINNEPILEPKALRFLSRHGFSTLRKDLNSPQDGGKLFTPLIKAAWEKDLDAVVGLVEAGADVSVANSLGNTAAHIAAERRDLFMYSWLRDHAANVRLANTSGVTAEQMAKQSFKFD